MCIQSAVYHNEKVFKASVACEQALCLGKNSEEREGKGGGGVKEPVDKHLRPLLIFRPLAIILPIICQ